MSFLSAIASFIGRILREVIPAIFEEVRRRRKVEQVGGDDDLRQDVNDSVDDMLNRRMSESHSEAGPIDGQN